MKVHDKTWQPRGSRKSASNDGLSDKQLAFYTHSCNITLSVVTHAGARMKRLENPAIFECFNGAEEVTQSFLYNGEFSRGIVCRLFCVTIQDS